MARFWRRRPAAAAQTWSWLVLLLVVVLGALAAAWYFVGGDETVEAERVPSVVGLEQDAPEPRVPDLLGRTTEEATAQLTHAGFRTRVRQVASPAPEGRVIAQEPAAGTRVQGGRVVRVTVSRGRTQTATTVVTTFGTQTTVPDVVGQDEATAAFTVEEGGFRVRVTNRTVSDPSEEGIVVQQLPRGGVTRRTGSTVTLVVGRLH